MLETRCKFYQADGTPIHEGCRNIRGCRFIHPWQKGWKDLQPYKAPVRCMYFDSHGNPIRGGCPAFKDCRYIHPGDRNWDIAQEPKRRLPEQSLPAVSSGSRSRPSEYNRGSEGFNEVAHRSFTDATKPAREPYRIPIPTASIHLATTSKPLASIPARSRQPEYNRRAESPKEVPHRSSTDIMTPARDPHHPSASTSSQSSTAAKPTTSTVDFSRQSEYGRRTESSKEVVRRFSTDAMKPAHEPHDSFIPTSSEHPTTAKPTTSATVQDSIDVQHALRSAPPIPMSSTLSQTQMNFQRPSVTPTSVRSSSISADPPQLWGRRVTLCAHAHELIQKIAEIDADLKRRVALQSTAGISLVAPSEAGLEILRDSVRNKQKPLEEKLNSVIAQLIEDDFWPVPPMTQTDVSNNHQRQELSASLVELGRRLDMIEAQFNQIRDLGNLHLGQISLEREIKEKTPRPSKRRRISYESFHVPFDAQAILARLDRLGIMALELETESLQDDRLLEKIDERLDASLIGNPAMCPVPANSFRDTFHNLDVELDAFCGELVDLNTDNLVSQIGAIQLEASDFKQKMDSLTLDQQALQKRQANLEQQTREVMREIDGLRMTRGREHIATDFDKIVGEVQIDIQGRIDTDLARILNSIQSYNEELKREAFSRLEPTIVKSKSIYNFVHSQTEAGRSSS